MTIIKRLSGSNEEISRILYEEQLQLSQQNLDVEEAVAEIIETVKQDGDQALRDYTMLFDKVEVTDFEIGQELIDQAFEEIDPEVLTALKNAQANIESYHRQQLETGFEDSPSEGVVRGQLIRPIERVGTYVPGGTAAYPSSVLMNVIPAKIAGVKEIIMITPPQEHFTPAILVAAKLAGVDRIFQIGGAQGVAALAYGTETIPKVDKITGPGNIFVATAKKMVYGIVGIDMIAGPSEVLIIADESADSVHTAADLLSQAEHDKLAACILVTTSQKLADEVAMEVEKQLKELPREEIARTSIETQGRIIVVENMDEAVFVSNFVAPEHLELAVDNPFELLPRRKNAGSIFMGHNTPEPLGDYLAGPNHTLPTSGTAKFSSPLSVDDFVKKSSFIYYSKQGLEEVKDKVIKFAENEGLTAHARSVSKRFDK